MGAREAPASPSSGADSGDDPGRTETVCCWCADYGKDISVNSYGRYFRKYKADGSEYSYNFPKRYHIDVPVNSGSEITVTVEFKVEPQSGVSEADATAAKTALERGVSNHWDSVFTIACVDPAAECPDKSFTVRYRVRWVEAGEDYTLKIHQTYAREGLSGRVMNVSKTTSAWVYAHEFAHATGLPDEYSYSTDTETVKYVKPDGTLDSAVSAPPSKPASDASATIMSTHSCNTVLARHGWNIAIETQELLRAELGRDIRCTVSK